MSNLVLALAAAALTVAGTVWYLPAAAELRAGADRPFFRRVSAAGCLTGWTACAGAVLLLLTGVPGPATVAAVAAGVTAAGCLYAVAGALRRRELRASARAWTELAGPAPVAPPGRSLKGRAARLAVAWCLSAVVLASTGTALLLMAASGRA
ncbi:hypothetical protein [Streptomyces hesseae]|uniref:DUF1772 domain-containing protein n=1 Tax=Streptomyces hesseae TaxID=3075519 RepID=A0ABU2SHI8_9ACTN|nr:hypothetical protein [Streptomyces sp. DSM 40473]MDT0448248.1 hypothetical protein [Streptomyces sp. DSM 40473]